MEITQVTQKSPSVWVLTLADGRSYEIDRTCVLEYALLNRLEIALAELSSVYIQGDVSTVNADLWGSNEFCSFKTADRNGRDQ